MWELHEREREREWVIVEYEWFYFCILDVQWSSLVSVTMESSSKVLFFIFVTNEILSRLFDCCELYEASLLW